MKNLLNDQDPLPKFGDGFYPSPSRAFVYQPPSNRRMEESKASLDKAAGLDWRDHTPGFEINGRGQLRTKDYKPPEPPETDVILMIAEDCFEVFWPNNTPRQEWADRFLKDLEHIIPSAGWKQGEHRFKLFELSQVYT